MKEDVDMASRFVVFSEVSEADYTVDGLGFKYIDPTPEEVEKIINEVSKYKVRKETVHIYSHDDYGDYETGAEVIEYDLDKAKSLSEKIWKKSHGAADIIIHDTEFFGVVFFTGFTDYRETEEFGFVPIECKDSRENLTMYTSVQLSVFKCKNQKGNPQHSSDSIGDYNGRVSTSSKTGYYLLKK